jgi:outer membrane lipoprotein-sorting protein
MEDPIPAAIAQFEALNSYRVTLRSSSPQHAPQVIRYAYRKPGWLRMDFETPHRGAVLVYDPEARKVRLWPFGLHRLPRLTLAPDNPLIRDPEGHRVDRSDVGALLRNVHALQLQGETGPVEEQQLGPWRTWHLSVTGAAGYTVEGVHRYQLWLEQSRLFPVKVVSYGADGRPLETVWMDDVEFDAALPQDWFTP